MPSRTGHLELARLDTVSDADALQKIQNNAENVTLEPGTYDAFATSDNVRDASVTAQSYYGMTYYAVTLTLRRGRHERARRRDRRAVGAPRARSP